MALSAYFVEDPITRIVSITLSVGAATFVVKTYDAEIFYGTPRGSPEQSEEWPQWSETIDLFGVAGSGSSSALVREHDADPGKPVWVVSARKEGGPDDSNGGVIMYSEDGATWELVFERYEVDFGDDRVPWFFEPTGIVWDEDEKAFFASFYTADFHSGESPEGEELYRSADGRSWSLVSRNLALPPGGDPATTPSDIAAYCNKPENQNRSGGSQKIPDGLQGYNSNTSTFIRPTGLRGFDPYNGAWYDGALTPSVTVIDADGNESIKPVDVVNCFAVAFHSGVWIAVGGETPTGTYIAASFDDGQTWARVFQNSATYYAATVSGQRKAT